MEDKLFLYTSQMVPIELFPSEAEVMSLQQYHYNESGQLKNTDRVPMDFCDYCKKMMDVSKNRISQETQIVAATQCTQVNAILDNLYREGALDFLLDIPKSTERDVDLSYYSQQLADMVSFFEKQSQMEISKEMIRKNICLSSQNNALLREIMELRKENSDVLSSLEARYIYQAKYGLSAEKYKNLLQEVKEKISKKNMLPSTKTRLMLVGPLASETLFDDTKCETIKKLFSLFEAADACFVLEQNYLDCIDDFDINDGDKKTLIHEIAKKYLQKKSYMLRADNTMSLEKLSQVAKEFNVDGVVYLSTKFCDTYAYHVGKFEKVFSDNSLPVLRLEMDYDELKTGQLSIRIETFVCMLKAKMKHKRRN